MGNKIDYRSKKEKNFGKKIKVILIIIVVIIVMYILIRSFINAYKSVVPQTNSDGTEKTYISVDEYESIEEILNKYGCTYIREETSDELLKIYVLFDRDLYSGETSNENFFNNLIMVIADFRNYASFELIDEVRDIDIVVTCEDSSIVEIEINGDENYYLNQDSSLNANKEKTTVTELSINSEEIQKLIDNGWNPTNLDLGTKDSTCDSYEIYFEEGFKYKVVGRTVYNIIFTTKYEGDIVAGLNANSSKEEVVANLGKVTFESTSIYGYLGEDMYVFFDFLNNQVSVYPVTEMEDEDDFIELIEAFNESEEDDESFDVKQFAMDLTSLWTDYDIYDFDSNYVDLQYTLRGVELNISSNSLKNGIYIYQNYRGDISNIGNLDNVYVQEDDLVFEEEKDRVILEGMNRVEQGEDVDSLYEEYGIKFAFRYESFDDDGYRGVKFYSRDEEYPDCELDDTTVISSYSWYDEYNFIYSVDNDGIYVYNCISQSNIQIISVEDEIVINSAGDGVIIYNDTETINIEFN